MPDTWPMPTLDRIIAHGTGYIPQKLRCTDGTMLSIGAGPNWYCRPRPANHAGGFGDRPVGYRGPFTHLEVCGDGDSEPIAYMPVDEARALVHAHGGEHHEQPEHQVIHDLAILTQPKPEPEHVTVLDDRIGALSTAWRQAREDTDAPAKLARINDAAATLKQARADGGAA